MKVETFFRGHLVNNEFQKSSQGRSWQNQNPWNLETHFEWFENPSLVTEAVNNAQKAFRKWKALSRSQRIEYLTKLQSCFEKHQQSFENLLVLETGKARWEAQAEAKLLSAKVRVSCSEMLQMMEQMEAGSESQFFRFQPRGVCAVLGPFNLPLHLSNGHIIPALMAGNTVIFKPSEHAPASASLYAQCFIEAGFPQGVLQMLQGGPEIGQALVEQSAIRGIFFTGSYPVGRKIVESLMQHRPDLYSLAALEMGGKNASIVHKDAPWNQAMSQTLLSAFATTGQRCSCSSRILVHEEIYEAFRSEFLNKVRSLSYGKPTDLKTFMGPLIHPHAVSKFQNHLEKARAEKFQVLIESEFQKDSCLVSPSVYESTDPEADCQKSSWQEEFFGPNTILMPYRKLEEAIHYHEQTPYGLVASVFTKDSQVYSACDQGIEVGLLNWNRGTVGASSKLPFGGVKKSGNNWPAGILSFFYCATPRSYLQGSSEFKKDELPQSLKEMW